MNMIPAPGRVLHQWSTRIIILQGLIDLALVAWHSLASPDLHFITAQQAVLGNIALTFLAGAAKLVQQQIPLTIEQKDAMIAAVEAAPTKGPQP